MTRAFQSSPILRKKISKNLKQSYFFLQKKIFPLSFPILGGHDLTRARPSSPFQNPGEGPPERDGGGRTNKRTNNLTGVQPTTDKYCFLFVCLLRHARNQKFIENPKYSKRKIQKWSNNSNISKNLRKTTYFQKILIFWKKNYLAMINKNSLCFSILRLRDSTRPLQSSQILRINLEKSGNISKKPFLFFFIIKI